MRNIFSQWQKVKNTREDGFTLIEIVGVIAIIGVLAAIAVPTFSRYQAELASVEDKTNLQQAAILVEQEAIDNNGLFPTYLANEIRENPDTANFVYTYSDDRTQWCLQATTPSGKLFVSSNDLNVTRDVCTQDNLGAGSQTPWVTPVVPAPVISAATNTWASTSPAAVAQVTWSPITCPLAAEDSAEWGAVTNVSYSVRVLNATRATPAINPTNWSSNTSATITLAGWLPGDSISYSVRARCSITSGVEYHYNSPFSPTVGNTVATFTVNPVAYSSTPTASWPAGEGSASYQASWETGYCPSGQMEYRLDARNTNNVTHTTGFLAWANNRTQVLPTTFTPGVSFTLSNIVSCVLTDGRRFNSVPTVVTLGMPLQPPAAPAGLTTNNGAGITSVVPNRVVWNAVTCTVGTPQYELDRIAPSAVSTGWVTFTQQDQSLTAGSTFTWNVQARCVSGSSVSVPSLVSLNHSVTAQFNIPPVPATPTGLTSDRWGGTIYNNDRLLWNAVSCVAGATASYQIRQDMFNGGSAVGRAISGWIPSTSFVVPQGWSAYGSRQGFVVQARCASSGGTSNGSAFSGMHIFTTEIPAPATPGNLHNDQWQWMGWGAVSCVPGTTPRYFTTQTRHANSWGSWNVRNWTGDLSGPMPIYSEGVPVEANVIARCDGPNASSPNSAPGNHWWTVLLNGPSVWTGLVAWRQGQVAGGCPSGTSAISPRIQMTTGSGSYRGQVNNWVSGSTYHNVAWGSPRATLNGWFRCQTAWRTSGEGFGTSKQ